MKVYYTSENSADSLVLIKADSLLLLLLESITDVELKWTNLVPVLIVDINWHPIYNLLNKEHKVKMYLDLYFSIFFQ